MSNVATDQERLARVEAEIQGLRTEAEMRDKQTEIRFSGQEKSVTTALASADRATTKAEMAAEKRFEATNEVKATFGSELTRKLDRTEYTSAHISLQKQVDNLSRILFIGLGIAIALQFVIPLLIKP